MKLTRFAATEMFRILGTLALGQMDEDTLEKTMDCFNALRKATDDFEALKKELFKRLYGDIETMNADERKDIEDFFDQLAKLERAKGEEAAEMEKTIKSAYPALYEVRMKEVKVLVSLLNKEIDVEVKELDENAFVKGVLKGNKNATPHEVAAWFAPLFKREQTTDVSELDGLI